nr:hypothetical protein [Candidatus Freyarchaeota archaeon]
MYFDIHKKVIDTIHEEFNAEKTVAELAQKISNFNDKVAVDAAEKFFTEWGRNLMTRALELGEEYQDRTYQVINLHAEKTGSFPSVPQRFIEICYLSVLQIERVTITESNLKRLGYNCRIYTTLKEKMGENLASQMPCKHACTSLAKTLFEKLNIQTSFNTKALMSNDGYCQFLAEKKP